MVMQLMMYRITQEMYLDRSKRKLVIIDEAWDLMGSGSSANFIEAGYQRARKYGGAFGTITQSVDDYYKNEATRAAITNADWLFLLRQKPESIDRLGKRGQASCRRVDEAATVIGQYRAWPLLGDLCSWTDGIRGWAADSSTRSRCCCIPRAPRITRQSRR